MSANAEREIFVWILPIIIFIFTTVMVTIPAVTEMSPQAAALSLLISCTAILYPTFIAQNKFGYLAKLFVPSIFIIISISLYITALIKGMDFWQPGFGWLYLFGAIAGTVCIATYSVLFLIALFLRKKLGLYT